MRDLGYRRGSCGAAGLNFHWATITLPPAVVDNVIVHALAHLQYPYHGDQCWEAVERAPPHPRAMKA